jgi:hypothetical protein
MREIDGAWDGWVGAMGCLCVADRRCCPRRHTYVHIVLLTHPTPHNKLDKHNRRPASTLASSISGGLGRRLCLPLLACRKLVCYLSVLYVFIFNIKLKKKKKKEGTGKKTPRQKNKKGGGGDNRYTRKSGQEREPDEESREYMVSMRLMNDEE